MSKYENKGGEARSFFHVRKHDLGGGSGGMLLPENVCI